MNNQKNQTVETKENEIIFTRTFNAPRELVFETYTTCEHLMNWWGPRTWPLSYCDMDFRTGGRWHYCMKGPNAGDESWGLARYKEITEPKKIVYDDYFSDKDANINPGMPSLEIICSFLSDGDKTILKTVTKVSTKEEVDKLVEMGMIEGITETWDRLEEHLADIH
jgi:uncharacterized protein YndB with AHSA1/START domain